MSAEFWSLPFSWSSQHTLFSSKWCHLEPGYLPVRSLTFIKTSARAWKGLERRKPLLSLLVAFLGWPPPEQNSLGLLCFGQWGFEYIPACSRNQIKSNHHQKHQRKTMYTCILFQTSCSQWGQSSLQWVISLGHLNLPLWPMCSYIFLKDFKVWSTEMNGYLSPAQFGAPDIWPKLS